MLDPVFFALGSPHASTCRSSQTAAYLRRGREFRRSSERDAVRVHDCAPVNSADSTGFDNASDHADHNLPASGTVPRIPVTYVLGGSTRSWQSYSPAKQSTERQWWYIQFTGAVESAVISIWQSSRQHLQGHHA
jgi:hypothetical protein